MYKKKLLFCENEIDCKNERYKGQKISKTDLFRILKRKDKIIYNESPFKPIIADIRSELSKKGYELIKNGLKYAEEVKELTNSQVKSFKENLIKFKTDLIMKNKINNRFGWLLWKK